MRRRGHSTTPRSAQERDRASERQNDTGAIDQSLRHETSRRRVGQISPPRDRRRRRRLLFAPKDAVIWEEGGGGAAVVVLLAIPIPGDGGSEED